MELPFRNRFASLAFNYTEKILAIEHIPVLLDETLQQINWVGCKTVLDVTAGGGGHAEAILQRIPQVRLLIATDKDEDAVLRVRKRLLPYGKRAVVEKADFIDMDIVLDRMGIDMVDAIVMDLGVSSFHLDDPQRGFSFRNDGPLDMRLDKSQELTAFDIVNERDEAELVKIFFEFGEERYARRIGKAIAREREKEAINGTVKLATIVERAIGHRGREKRSTHPATKIFQALRIAVNRELEIIEEAIKKGVDRLSTGGRIAVISFHSGEDRIVKRTFFDLTERCVCPKEIPMCVCGRAGKVKLLTKKPLRPEKEEEARNPRARSSRLRAAEKI